MSLITLKRGAASMTAAAALVSPVYFATSSAAVPMPMERVELRLSSGRISSTSPLATTEVNPMARNVLARVRARYAGAAARVAQRTDEPGAYEAVAAASDEIRDQRLEATEAILGR